MGASAAMARRYPVGKAPAIGCSPRHSRDFHQPLGTIARIGNEARYRQTATGETSMTVRKWGVETLVNTNTPDFQGGPAITALTGGGYVVAWTDNDAAGGDGSSSSAKFQRYDDAGNKVGGEAIANVTAAGGQEVADAFGTDDGGFIIVWRDGPSGDVEYRRFSAAGTALDATDLVLVQAGNQFGPASTTLGTGFIIAFQDENSSEIRAQRFFADGTTNGAVIDVSVGGDDDGASAVAELAGGGFIVAWRDFTTDQVRIRGFDSSGIETFAAKDVALAADTIIATPSITALANGSFVVAWSISNSIYPDASGSVRAHVVSFAGTLIGSEFTVNTETTNNQNQQSLAALPGGGFVAVYTSDGDIRGQIFDNFGERVGNEFQVNTVTAGQMVKPVVTVLADGRLAVSWETIPAGSGADLSFDSVHMQILDPRDGVVTGTGIGETLYGHNLVNDEINGLGGADTLIGLGGSDDLYGGDGGDTYIVGAGDTVFELFNGGTDTVRSSLSYALGANVENLVLLAGTTGAGNGLANTITGNGGANILDGKAGADTMIGLAGNDTYLVDVAGDITTEAAGGGIDTVKSSVTRVLGVNLENLTLTGTTAINGTGNGLANTMSGNSAANRLTGLAGKDILTGNNGNDTFVYTLASDSHGTTIDVIKDFDDHGNDRIDLSALFSGALTYRGSLAFTGAHQVRIHDIAGPDVLIEVNLSGSLSPELTIRLAATTAASMTGSDFIL
jgi:serralysin